MVSRSKRIRDIIVRQEELRQRAAWAQGEDRQKSLAELEELSGMLDALKGGRRR